MRLSSMSPDVAWSVFSYVLAPGDGPMIINFPGSDASKFDRLQSLVRFSSTCRVARTLIYGDTRFKGLMLCVAPGRETRGVIHRWLQEVVERGEGGMAYAKAPDAWREDRAVVLAAVRLDGDTLHTVDSRFLEDKEIVVAAIEHERSTILAGISNNQMIYAELSEELRLDHDVARAALGNIQTLDAYLSHRKPEIFPAQIRDSKEVMLDAMSETLPLNYASERLRGDRDVVLAAVSQERNNIYPNLQHAPDALRDDRRIVEAAMRGTGGGFLSLQYASARLRDDRALASEAIQSYVVKHAHGLEMGFDKMSTRLKSDRALFMEALAKYDDLQNPPSFASHFLHAADVSLRDDKELVLEVVRRDACGIEIASERLRDDRDVVLLAVCSSGDLLEFASEALRADRDVVLAAVQNVGYSLTFAAEELQDDFDIALAACTNEGAALELVSPRLRNDRSIRAAARAERAALLARCGGIDNLCNMGVHKHPDRDYQREMRASDYNVRPPADPYAYGDY